ncbi:replication initiation protein [Tetragenococcus koreensis]|uniref:Replication initiation protein n=3 Tax=Tetragenococcus TaxID=51668 RepID=A0A3G5FFR8_9ENTE|nr:MULTISPECIES: replication initiation protein [Tetragenococcus]MDN6249064.1 replication initiation protein [Lactococcus lactis]MDN6310637.1 replication initiation protein [Psychroflexus sp.]MDN6545452.1 replication initiation protein [Enterococcaceae bacterium]GMA55375.1 replication initiation protein [Alicyclobacillus contaminans]AYW46883.1 replication initiation protein [Tetragenococcus koreensis]
MSNDVVRYNSGFDTVPLRNFTPVEMDLFWSICSKMKRKGTQEVTFSFETFKELTHYDRREKDKFYTALKTLSEKLGTLTYKFEDEKEFEQLWLFQRFLIRKEEKTVTIQASERFEFILNSIGSNFTRFELENMTQLSSSYVKELYRQLMSHRDIKKRNGAWFIKMDDFRSLLSIPASYRMTDIDNRILNKAKSEFLAKNEYGRQIFKSFKVEKVKARKKNKISSLRIYFEEADNLPHVTLHDWTQEEE